jgi:multiple sugar transport system permease protein
MATVAGGTARAGRGTADEPSVPGRARRHPTRAPWYVPYLFLAPYLVLFAAFALIPAGLLVWISLHDWDFLLPGKPWVGLDNYRKLFDSGSTVYSDYWKSMKATGIFTVFSVPLLVSLPLLLALLLNRNFTGRSFFRGVFFAPFVLGVGVIGVLWQYLLDPNVGPINHWLGAIGVRDDIPWTTDTPWVWVSLIGATVWWTVGYNTVIYLAGLQDIPRELYEAAKVDGASPLQRFRHVTLPGIRVVLVFVVIITILASANMFGQSYLITNGAPAQESRTAIMYIAEEGLRNFHMGDAAAMSLVLTAFLMLASIVTVLAMRWAARD